MTDLLNGLIHLTSMLVLPGLAYGSQLAFGALIEAASLRVDVPGEISITGFNDLDYAAHLDPPLTTLRVPVEQMGAMAGDYIVSSLQGEPVAAVAEIDVSLIVRGSTAPPPARRSTT